MLTYLLFDLPIDVNLIADADLHVVNYKKGCTRLAAASDKVYQLLAHGRWFSPGPPASSTTKTGEDLYRLLHAIQSISFIYE